MGADPNAQRLRAVRVLRACGGRDISLPEGGRAVLPLALQELAAEPVTGGTAFHLTPFVADEMSLLTDLELPRYIYHRYRYDIYPARRLLDAYPPYIQIEPSSVCNYRCPFCYQREKTFSAPNSGFMGSMSLKFFKSIVDQIAGHIEFGSLASRGEPLICPDIDAMVTYCAGKFLNLKMNTNGALLNERHAHALLSGGIQTLVFSIDASNPDDYRRWRVNGDYDKVRRNIEAFQRLRERQYSTTRLITRVSGVLMDPARQSLKAMVDAWGDLVDQIAFVKYNPWENVYEAEGSGISEPCSDLWRRLFVWYDGTVNPCDTDYHSTLAVGRLPETGISGVWTSARYQQCRLLHAENCRAALEPCRRCSVT